MMILYKINSKKVRSFMSKIKIVLLFFIVISIINVGCINRKEKERYSGLNPELYSIAINSLLGARGYIDSSEMSFHPELTILESDQYGRKLFLYYENNIISTYSLFISQKSDLDYAYFYPDYNFISAPENIFTEEDIHELKTGNDWDKEIVMDKCNKVEIVYEKDLGGSIESENVMELYRIILGEDASRSMLFIDFFTKDNYGRSIYLGTGEVSEEGEQRRVVMLFQPDGKYDESNSYMELTDFYNYQDELKEFKDLNDWNKPTEE